MSTFDNKKVWFSKLKYASPLTIKFTSDPMPSKFNKNELIAFFEVQGDETKYNIVVENAVVKSQVESAPKNKWLSVSGEGNSADDQTLVISAASGESYSAPAAQSNSNTGGGAVERYGPGNVMACLDEVIMVVEARFEDVSDSSGITEHGKWFINTVLDKWFSSGRFMPLYEGQPLESFYNVDAEDAPPEEIAQEEDAVNNEEKFAALSEWLKKIKWVGQSHDDKSLPSVKKHVTKVIKEKDATLVDAATVWCATEFAAQLSEPDDDLPF